MQPDKRILSQFYRTFGILIVFLVSILVIVYDKDTKNIDREELIKSTQSKVAIACILLALLLNIFIKSNIYRQATYLGSIALLIAIFARFNFTFAPFFSSSALAMIISL